MTTTNNIKLNFSGTFANGQQWEANIRLNDECKNGHEDFAITGTIWEKGKPKTDKNTITGGAIGDRLAKINKHFALLNDLHLCDFNGVPMHATANMFYHLQNGFQNLKGDFKTEFCKYYRITEEQFNKLSEAREQEHFTAIFISMPEILENWKKQANEAIKWLEEKTVLKFKSEATRSNLILPDADKLTELSERLKNGYYNPELANERAVKRESERRAKAIQDKKDVFNKKVEELSQDLALDIALIEIFGTDNNVIFYKHTNTVVFNWQKNNTYGKTWTNEEFEVFKQKTDFEKRHVLQFSN